MSRLRLDMEDLISHKRRGLTHKEYIKNWNRRMMKYNIFLALELGFWLFVISCGVYVYKTLP